jgi:hypothetical protein
MTPLEKRCALCRSSGRVECHHVATKRHCSTLTLDVCIPCHQQLSHRQTRWYPGWRVEARPVYCITQGCWDVLAVWYERSPVVDAVRDLLSMLFSAAILLLGLLGAHHASELALLRNTTIY